ncbi:hypothetical protein [Desulfobotulus sp.]|jgi:hypothetical protein|uniref:hypothetical protein n=1 Tax=Desulfobotulus sp. TaxID=1940337 RepID=UPI002A3665E0|nr:hypothetical protein [Desulfobotulus sp.]MDY0162666.1 hypothetical protein [Desulfobotulus sp.]
MVLCIGMTHIPLTARFGELLIEKGLATPRQVDQALSRQKALHLQHRHIRIGDLLHSECGIDRNAMEEVFLSDLFSQILLRLRGLIAADADIPAHLSCTLIQARILQEGTDILQGEADIHIVFPDNQEQTFLLTLPFDFRFSDHSTSIDLPEAIDQIKNGLNDAITISPSEQRTLGITIASLKSET